MRPTSLGLSSADTGRWIRRIISTLSHFQIICRRRSDHGSPGRFVFRNGTGSGSLKRLDEISIETKVRNGDRVRRYDRVTGLVENGEAFGSKASAIVESISKRKISGG